MDEASLQVRITPGSTVEKTADPGWLLTIPAGASGEYRWAQLDDYMQHRRSDFAWEAPVRLTVRARVSSRDVQGTWGFGFWNDPFNASLGLGGSARRLPALPNTAWLFYASHPNYLSLRDSHPAQGMLAATFSSPCIPPALLGFTAPILPLMAWKTSARWLRNAAACVIQEDARQLPLDVCDWHEYQLECTRELVRFRVDQTWAFETAVAPRGRLGLVIWIDNQYAAFPPDGKLSFGTLAAESPAWLEIADLRVELISDSTHH